MTQEEKEILSRARDLSARAWERGVYTRTPFLSPEEQELILTEKTPLPPVFEGGYPEAERRVAIFGSREEFGYDWESDLVLLKAEPQSPKYADPLTHRDFLGAMMNLGLDRSVIGDILIYDNVGYVFVLKQMAPYLAENLKKARHTALKVSQIDALPAGVGVTLEEETVLCASTRVDAVIGGVFHLPRSRGKELVESGCVRVRGKAISRPDHTLTPGDRVSVRGYGKFCFDGEESKTRGGRGRMKIRLFR